MFGVFDKEELDWVDAWLDEVAFAQSLDVRESNAAQNPLPFNAVELSRRSGMDCRYPEQMDVNSNIALHGNWIPAIPAGTTMLNINSTALPLFGRADNRTLFHLLINRDAQAKTLAAARQRVERVLAYSRHFQRNKGPLQKRFFDYSPQTLAQRIVQLHTMEVAKHKPFQAPPKLRREEYIWGIRQFAPAILVDGCWLQHMGEAASQGCRPQRLLFRIYAEELGSGIINQNHPKIYRDLLDGLGIGLASVETVAFARDSSLLDAAFDLPCYLLAISQYPKTYFPEMLGLNLAIELSGLGGDYMRLAEELRYWNIDPLIVTLHLSIDNLAGGHAAMACEAIQLYMDEILLLGGTPMRDEIWRRVWSGYLSLNTVTRRFKWALMLGFCRHFLPRRLFSRWLG